MARDRPGHTDNAVDAVGQQIDAVAEAQALLDGIGIETLITQSQSVAATPVCTSYLNLIASAHKALSLTLSHMLNLSQPRPL